eukprot:COSAG02_NODE_14885_length_1226_cov_2.167702_2_plen_22_part_01
MKTRVHFYEFGFTSTRVWILTR